MIEDQIERITYYEGLLTKATGMLDDESADKKELSKIIDELESYYTSDLWKKDFAADEEGKLPADLKRGVLSEDGISNVLDRFKELSAGAKATESTKVTKSARKPLAVFYGVTLALSFLVELYCVMTQNENIILFLMWIPGIVGIICAKIFYPKQKAIGFFVKFKFRYVIYGILIPVVYLVVSYLIGWEITKDPTIGLIELSSTINGGTESLQAAIITLAIYFGIGIPISAITATGEELGWRGFAYPLLEQEFGPVKAVLINSSVWALWHLPLIIGGVYQAEVNVVYGIFAFILCILVISVFFCWSRSVSGSVIPAILLHSVHNLVDQSYLQPLSTKENLPYFAGEQGFVTILIGALMAYVVIISWKKSRAKIKARG